MESCSNEHHHDFFLPQSIHSSPPGYPALSLKLTLEAVGQLENSSTTVPQKKQRLLQPNKPITGAVGKLVRIEKRITIVSEVGLSVLNEGTEISVLSSSLVSLISWQAMPSKRTQGSGTSFPNCLHHSATS